MVNMHEKDGGLAALNHFDEEKKEKSSAGSFRLYLMRMRSNSSKRAGLPSGAEWESIQLFRQTNLAKFRF